MSGILGQLEARRSVDSDDGALDEGLRQSVHERATALLPKRVLVARGLLRSEGVA